MKSLFNSEDTGMLHNKKVKINVQLFESQKTSKRFRNFIEKNKDSVFTAELDFENGYTQMYTLKEDSTDPKWLFYVDMLVSMEDVDGNKN